MSKFTPGPWEIYYEGSGDYLVVQSESRDEVCGVSRPDAHFMHVGKGAPINEANAHLIAAAPLLFSFAQQKAIHGDPWAAKIIEAIESGADTGSLWR